MALNPLGPAAPPTRGHRWRPGPFDLSTGEVSRLLQDEPPYRLTQVLNGLRRRSAWVPEMTELPQSLRDRLAEPLAPGLTPVDRCSTDGGATVKWTFATPDGARVETVLMAYPSRTTVCVSTQAGCAMGCPFCATGQGGFRRHLTSGEIVEQVAWARRERPVTHVVLMGMGEPLANYDRTVGALQCLHRDLGISARRLTVSTVGIVPGIRRLATEELPVNLAVSLHAANDALRDRLVPINRRYPLASLAEACADWTARTRRRLSLEWAVIGGVNDRPADAEELVRFARPLRAHVNLIPLNVTPGFRAPRPGGTTRFATALREAGLNVTIRDTRGSQIGAACGQLAGPQGD